MTPLVAFHATTAIVQGANRLSCLILSPSRRVHCQYCPSAHSPASHQRVAAMGGGTFLYPPCTPLSQRTSQQSSSTCNPKAVTEAAYLAAQDSPRSAQDGPLLRFDGEKVDYTPKAYDDLHTRSRKRPLSEATTVNYNQHPDSWTVFAGHNVQYKPMPAHTKTAVTYVRRAQLGLRVLTELAAVGLLVAMILIQNISNVISWLLRVAVSLSHSGEQYTSGTILTCATACMGCDCHSLCTLPSLPICHRTHCRQFGQLPCLRPRDRCGPPPVLHHHVPQRKGKLSCEPL